jgi:hemerythrin
MPQYFKWSEDYNLGITEIDNQHKHFVSILDSVYDSILNSATREKQEELLNSLVDYTIFHFQTEEKYFDLFDFSGKSEHKEEHRLLKEQVFSFQNDFKLGHKDLSYDLIDFLEDWLVNHLTGMDKKYVECFQKNGLK